MDTKAEPTGFPMSIQNAALPKTTQLGHKGVSNKPSVKASASNPAKSGQVSLLSPTPLSDKNSNSSQKNLATEKEICDESSIVGHK